MLAFSVTKYGLMKTSNDIRDTFLEYFRERGHEIVPSSPLVPGNDPTLLFTNAGMVQFKDVFLGDEPRPYNRATTSQRCVRAGGKHNDLENVGYTARHHTFFEMMGNFSFGDYFKRDAIRFCWELLTEVYGLPKEKLWVTVFEDDDEAEQIWFEDIGIDRSKFSRCGAKDNFWSMGDTGPCGPCSEVFYDHGPEILGGPPGSPDEDGDRYIEIWNLVFMQFNRTADGTLTPLPRPSVDTGMGLERLAAVVQGVHSNYETDLFSNLIDATVAITKASDREDKSLRVIADHIRSCAFLVVDGVVPSNEGRGYVLRRIIRRAIRHGHRLGVTDPFFHRLVGALDQEMGDAYPELRNRREAVERVLRQEEERFAETLEQGMRMLEESIADLSGTRLPGAVAFKLYDTYGFPVDLTADVARERGLSVDMDGFERAMQQQREQARGASQFQAQDSEKLPVDVQSTFEGYDKLACQGSVSAILRDGESSGQAGTEEQAALVLDQSPFYAESGGQVGDSGILSVGKSRFEVQDTRKVGGAIVHYGVVTEGSIKVGDVISAQVDAQRRQAIARNHSATHLLHAALRNVLGEHVSQKGSLVAADRLRFDFSHFEPMTSAEVSAIEQQVNAWVLSNNDANTQVMALEDAKKSGAMALFGEKYDDPVRVFTIGDYSVELCGGTHVSRSGDIGLFKLVAETGVAAGVRRIEAVTGTAALQWAYDTDARLARIASMVKSEREGVDSKVDQLVARTRELEKEVERLKGKLAACEGDDLLSRAVDVNGLQVLAAKLDGVDPKGLRDVVDQLKNKLGSAAVVLATVSDGKVSLVAGVTKGWTDRIAAGPLANHVAQQVGGRGGGRPDMAQAGGSDPTHIDTAIGSVVEWVRTQLNN
jgi:alanyl-tRNA synthetase